MKLDAQEIVDLVNETEKKRANWARAADTWEEAWKLAANTDSPENKWELDGVHEYVSPDPFNVILMLQRLIAHEMRIEVPYLTTKEKDSGRSSLISEWLTTFDVLSNRQYGVNHANDMAWQSGVLGRGAAQVLWIGDVIPKGVSTSNVLPVWRRTIDPRMVGISRGPYWTDYAYHKYEVSRQDIMQRYPKYKLPEVPEGKVVHGLLNERYTLIDMWTLHEGAIWHHVVIQGGSRNGPKAESVLGPVKTDYPDIPIIEWFADGAPVHDELWRSLSILHPIIQPWKAKNRMMSKFMTAIEYTSDPAVIFKGFNQDEDAAEFGPGAKIFVRDNQSVEGFRVDPNYQMLQAFMGSAQSGMDQATFNSVAYGDAPGGVSAGFAINNLSQASQARPTVIRQNIEAAMEMENQHILALIEAFAEDKGVTIFKRSTNSERGKPLTLNKRIIKGNYDNEVRLIPENPLADTQKLTVGSNMADKRLISNAYFRDEFVNKQMPQNEETRIAFEDAMKSPEMQPVVYLAALQDTLEEKEWRVRIAGTSLEQLWQRQEQVKRELEQQEEMERQQRKAEKEQKRLEELLASGKAHVMPDGSIMEGPPMMPPMPPDMGQPPMPMPGIPPGMEQPPMPPPTGGPGLPPGMPMQPPGQAGLPPAMAGQLTPEALGLPPGAPPGMFQNLTGQAPPTDEELLQRMIGGQPPLA